MDSNRSSSGVFFPFQKSTALVGFHVVALLRLVRRMQVADVVEDEGRIDKEIDCLSVSLAGNGC